MLLMRLSLLCLFLALTTPLHALKGNSSPGTAGKALENTIEGILRSKGFTIIPSSQWNEARLHRTTHPKFLIKNVPYKSIFGHRARMEFLLIFGDRQILIESKRQKWSGSTDEKLPYIYQNALLNLPDQEMILVMGGHGWKKGAVKWIRKKADETNGFQVMTLDEFISWTVKTF